MDPPVYLKENLGVVGEQALVHFYHNTPTQDGLEIGHDAVDEYRTRGSGQLGSVVQPQYFVGCANTKLFRLQLKKVSSGGHRREGVIEMATGAATHHFATSLQDRSRGGRVTDRQCVYDLRRASERSFVSVHPRSSDLPCSRSQ